MYIHTIVSVATIAVVGIVAGSIDYNNYLVAKSDHCTEITAIIDKGTLPKTCTNGHQEVFRIGNNSAQYMIHCSCAPVCNIEQHQDGEIMQSHSLLKTKPQPYGLNDRIF